MEWHSEPRISEHGQQTLDTVEGPGLEDRSVVALAHTEDITRLIQGSLLTNKTTNHRLIP